MEVQKLVIDLFGTAITYIASGVVWLTLVAGMFQLARAGIRRVSHVLSTTAYSSRHYSSKASKVSQHV